MSERSYGPHRIELTHREKVFFPGSGITKGELVDYYERVAEWMVPHVKDRPLSMERFPDGIEGDSFFQKQRPDYFPDWIRTASIPLREGGSQSQVLCNGKETLVYLATQACVTPHVWQSRRDRLDVPDRMVFDLDPPSEDFGPVRDAARRVREILHELGLDAFLMLTGSRGAHVVVPLRREENFDRIRSLAQAIARQLAKDRPEDLTIARRKQERGDRLFLDTSRNAYGQTTVAPYAVRARPGAPVATPIDWDELSRVTSSRYTIRNLFRRLSRKPDPWGGIGSSPQAVKAAIRLVDR